MLRLKRSKRGVWFSLLNEFKLLDVTDSEHCSLPMITDCLHFYGLSLS